MATLEQVMQALEARLSTIEKLRVSDTVPGQINPPQAIVGVPPIENYQTGLTRYAKPTLALTITVFTSMAMDRVGQLALAAYADPTGARSIPAALLADKTLGGIVGDCMVTRFDPLGIDEVGVLGYFGGRFTLRVLT